jgi:hypothetical protein
MHCFVLHCCCYCYCCYYCLCCIVLCWCASRSHWRVASVHSSAVPALKPHKQRRRRREALYQPRLLLLLLLRLLLLQSIQAAATSSSSAASMLVGEAGSVSLLSATSLLVVSLLVVLSKRSLTAELLLPPPRASSLLLLAHSVSLGALVSLPLPALDSYSSCEQQTVLHERSVGELVRISCASANSSQASSIGHQCVTLLLVRTRVCCAASVPQRTVLHTPRSSRHCDGAQQQAHQSHTLQPHSYTTCMHSIRHTVSIHYSRI